jgi:hypothetical protein
LAAKRHSSTNCSAEINDSHPISRRCLRLATFKVHYKHFVVSAPETPVGPIQAGIPKRVWVSTRRHFNFSILKKMINLLWAHAYFDFAESVCGRFPICGNDEHARKHDGRQATRSQPEPPSSEGCSHSYVSVWFGCPTN